MFSPPPDCLRCGACCHSPSERFVRVTGANWTHLVDAADRLAHAEAYKRGIQEVLR